jgi:hypothetical protein
MTDITKIAADCATRIMDRMEMCRGSAILKGDIEREVEMALRQASGSGIPSLSGLQEESVKVFDIADVFGLDSATANSLIGKAMKALSEDGWAFAAGRQKVELPYIAPTVAFEDDRGIHRFATLSDLIAYRSTDG